MFITKVMEEMLEEREKKSDLERNSSFAPLHSCSLHKKGLSDYLENLSYES